MSRACAGYASAVADRTRLSGAHVYDVRAGSFRDLEVVVEGDRIVAVDAPMGASSAGTIDLGGAFLLPGLIDCHVHLTIRGEDADPSATAGRSDDEIARYAADAAERTVRAGVTTVRDLGGWNYVELDLRERIERGTAVGPRIVPAGRLLSLPTPAVRYYPGMYEVCEGPDGVRAGVRAQIGRGAGVIKVMATGAILSPPEEDARAAQFSPGELRAAVDAASEAGIPVAAHAHAAEGIRAAVEAGVASIEHGTFAGQDELEAMAHRGVFLVPTLGALHHERGAMPDLPQHIRHRFDDVRATHLEAVRNAHRVGVPLAMGTDAGAPGDQHGKNAMEVVRLVRAIGLTPGEAIRAATADAARLLRVDAGAIEPGRLADVITVRADPLEDISALTRATFVMAAGRVVRNDLEAQAEPAPR
jgi:imidazolonepropionase-like amidohydrolase